MRLFFCVYKSTLFPTWPRAEYSKTLRSNALQSLFLQPSIVVVEAQSQTLSSVVVVKAPNQHHLEPTTH